MTPSPFAEWSERFQAWLIDVGIVFGTLFVLGIGVAGVLQAGLFGTVAPGNDPAAGVGALIGLSLPPLFVV